MRIQAGFPATILSRVGEKPSSVRKLGDFCEKNKKNSMALNHRIPAKSEVIYCML